MKVLITYGGTKEKIDSVRAITNTSTGKTGQIVAQTLKEKGFEVTAIRARNAPRFNIEDLVFESHKELDTLLKEQLNGLDFDALIHLAAVSDYLVDEVYSADGESLNKTGDKIDSGKEVLIRLKPSKKIIQSVKDYSLNKDLSLIGFKLTNGASVQECLDAVTKVIESGADYVVHNDLSEIDESQHIGKIFLPNLEIKKHFTNKEELAIALYHLLEEKK